LELLLPDGPDVNRHEGREEQNYEVV